MEIDISNELSRTYTIVTKKKTVVYEIADPQTVTVVDPFNFGKESHIVVDVNGKRHNCLAPGRHGTVLVRKMRDGTEIVERE